MSRWAGLPIRVDTRSRTLAQISSALRVGKQRHGIVAASIDYLQLMRLERMGNREQEVANASRELAALASELEIVLFVLCQLNRQLEGRPLHDRRPRMSDLRESGAIEQDADIIGFIYRDEQYHDDSYSNPEEIGKADLKIAKHRNGATGNIKLAFIGQYARFEDLAYEDQFQNVTDDQIDTAYLNNMTHFDQEPF